VFVSKNPTSISVPEQEANARESMAGRALVDLLPLVSRVLNATRLWPLRSLFISGHLYNPKVHEMHSHNLRKISSQRIEQFTAEIPLPPPKTAPLYAMIAGRSERRSSSSGARSISFGAELSWD
jgi:hypothetical protein